MRNAVAIAVLLGTLVTGTSAIGSAAPGYGVVTGSMRIFGGVENSPPAGYPTSGRVVFQEVQGRTLTIGVGKSGLFTVKLKPGVYTAFGGPSGWFPNCHTNNERKFRVTADHSVKIVVACNAL